MTVIDSFFDFSGLRLNTNWLLGTLDLTLLNNTFKLGALSTNLNIYSPYGLSHSVRVQRNRFIEGLVSMNIQGPRLLDISDNGFYNCSSSTLTIGLIRASNVVSPTEENNAVKITNNLFRNNSGTDIVNLNCKVWGSYYLASIQMTGNTFYNNSATNVLSHNCPGLFLTTSTFQNPRSSFDYRSDVTFDEESTLYATGNFWNSSDYGDIAARVYDKQDDSSRSAVEVSPWFKDVNLTSLEKLENAFFRSNGFEIGGSLTENITLRNNGQPYVVVEEILVPADKTLSIQEGVQLVFKQGGITVEGKNSFNIIMLYSIQVFI